MKIEIKSWLTGRVLFEGDFGCIADAVKAANKAWANLSGADLSWADLSEANLSRANLHAFTQIAFSGHGERGRMLTIIQRAKGAAPELFCGCFTGSVDDLRKYIANGAPQYRKTRTLALDTALILLLVRNEESQS